MANAIARRLRKQMTPQEVKLWAQLRPLRHEPGAWKFRRRVPLRGYAVDFACFKARLIIEVDSSQHGIGDHLRRDRERDETLRRSGFEILRFWNAEIDHEFDGVWRVIMGALLNAELRDLPPPVWIEPGDELEKGA